MKIMLTSTSTKVNPCPPTGRFNPTVPLFRVSDRFCNDASCIRNVLKRELQLKSPGRSGRTIQDCACPFVRLLGFKSGLPCVVGLTIRAGVG